MESHEIDVNGKLTISEVLKIVRSDCKLTIGEDAEERINKCRAYLDKKLSSNEEPIYGINTGFGSLCNTVISNNDLHELQRNLVLSHACGMGEEVPQEIVRIMLFLKIQGLSHGHSGVHINTIQRLIDMFNENVLPVIYQQGSLGASGDLAPLAHLALPLIGEGEVMLNGERISSKKALDKLGWEPVELEAKEGLALLNGTQFMSAYGTWCIGEAHHLLRKSDFVAAASMDAFDCRTEPFKESIHRIRNHPGQTGVASAVRDHLEGSEIAVKEKEQVQDPYSFRCVPQVHGATLDTIKYVRRVVETEINSVTDNPTIFPAENDIISAGNFHGQPLALALDFLSIAMAELGSISERRTYKLISGQRNLPEFLTPEPGLNSGFMIPQYTAASMVSQNKQLATPSSVDSIDSSNGQEDHVSMGANAATKCFRVVQNCWKILGIEWCSATQALDLRAPLKSSARIEEAKAEYRNIVPFIEKDELMHEHLVRSASFIRDWIVVRD